MPTYRHPSAPDDAPGYAPARIHVSRGDRREVRDDGTFDAPRVVAEAIAERFDTTASAMRVDADGEARGESDADDADADTCEVVKSDGEVCGRDRPCPYHD